MLYMGQTAIFGCRNDLPQKQEAEPIAAHAAPTAHASKPVTARLESTVQWQGGTHKKRLARETGQSTAPVWLHDEMCVSTGANRTTHLEQRPRVIQASNRSTWRAAILASRRNRSSCSRHQMSFPFRPAEQQRGLEVRRERRESWGGQSRSFALCQTCLSLITI